MNAAKKVKVNREWLESNIFNHEFNGKVWKEVIEDHDCIFNFEFEVRAKGSHKLYGIRVGINDSRLYRNQLYITPTVGNYEFI